MKNLIPYLIFCLLIGCKNGNEKPMLFSKHVKQISHHYDDEHYVKFIIVFNDKTYEEVCKMLILELKKFSSVKLLDYYEDEAKQILNVTYSINAQEINVRISKASNMKVNCSIIEYENKWKRE